MKIGTVAVQEIGRCLPRRHCQRGDVSPTEWALEHAKALHHCDGVMPHSFKYSRLFRYDSELKLPAAFPPVVIVITFQLLCFENLRDGAT
jgi:hypothetical protein